MLHSPSHLEMLHSEKRGVDPIHLPNIWGSKYDIFINFTGRNYVFSSKLVQICQMCIEFAKNWGSKHDIGRKMGWKLYMG